MTSPREGAGLTSAALAAKRLRSVVVLCIVFGIVILLGGVGISMGNASAEAPVAVVVGLLFLIVGVSLGGPLAALRKAAKSGSEAPGEAHATFDALAKSYRVQIVVLCVLAALGLWQWVRANF